MAEKVQHHDFVEVNYTGKLADGTVFDTTVEAVAHNAGLPHQHGGVKPAIVCVGEKQLLPSLDSDLVDKEVGKEYTTILPPESAFGKRDIKKMRIVPMSTFKEQKVNPQPGLQVDIDGELGVITRVAGGRIIVNFNHPLAGKEVTYTFTITKKITDLQEQISAFLQSALHIPKEKITVQINEQKATVELPFALPLQFTEAIGKKVAELTKMKEVSFTAKTTKKE